MTMKEAAELVEAYRVFYKAGVINRKTAIRFTAHVAKEARLIK